LKEDRRVGSWDQAAVLAVRAVVMVLGEEELVARRDVVERVA
jgi:hypothetical protein